jgi:uncharacterized membrane protein YobD (UPF0266 family)
MGLRNHSGRIQLRAVVSIAILIILAYGLYKFVPWAWHGWHALRDGLKLWWRVQMAEPIFRGLIYVLLVAGGRPLLALSTIALLNWIFNRTVGSISVVSIRKVGQQSQIFQENLIGQMENVQVKLTRLFADDIEKIALFGGKISSSQPETPSGNPLSIGFLGCLPGMIWMAIAMPIMIMVGIAIYDGVLRLFVTPEPVESLMAFAGSNAEALKSILPIPQSVSMAGVWTVNLSERSLVLTAILCIVGFLYWLVDNISNSGWTFPRLVSFAPLYVYLFAMIVSYIVLPAALLIFAISWMTYSLIHVILKKLLFRPLTLRAQAILVPRTRAHRKSAEGMARA